jgi:hypothetical protein
MMLISESGRVRTCLASCSVVNRTSQGKRIHGSLPPLPPDELRVTIHAADSNGPSLQAVTHTIIWPMPLVRFAGPSILEQDVSTLIAGQFDLLTTGTNISDASMRPGIEPGPWGLEPRSPPWTTHVNDRLSGLSPRPCYVCGLLLLPTAASQLIPVLRCAHLSSSG